MMMPWNAKAVRTRRSRMELDQGNRFWNSSAVVEDLVQGGMSQQAKSSDFGVQVGEAANLNAVRWGRSDD